MVVEKNIESELLKESTKNRRKAMTKCSKESDEKRKNSGEEVISSRKNVWLFLLTIHAKI